MKNLFVLSVLRGVCSVVFVKITVNSVTVTEWSLVRFVAVVRRRVANHWRACTQAPTNHFRSRDVAASDRCHSDIDGGRRRWSSADCGRQMSPSSQSSSSPCSTTGHQRQTDHRAAARSRDHALYRDVTSGLTARRVWSCSACHSTRALWGRSSTFVMRIRHVQHLSV